MGKKERDVGREKERDREREIERESERERERARERSYTDSETDTLRCTFCSRYQLRDTTDCNANLSIVIHSHTET